MAIRTRSYAHKNVCRLNRHLWLRNLTKGGLCRGTLFELSDGTVYHVVSAGAVGDIFDHHLGIVDGFAE